MQVQTLYLSSAIFNLTVSPDNNVQWNGHAYSSKSHLLAAVATNVMKSSISRIFVDILSAQPKLGPLVIYISSATYVAGSTYHLCKYTE